METSNNGESDESSCSEAKKSACDGIKSESEISHGRLPSDLTNSTKRAVSRKVSSSNSGSGNNSDNSANSVLSLGNNSFGFNFDENEGMMPNSLSPPNADIELGGKPAMDQNNQTSKKRSREQSEATVPPVAKCEQIGSETKFGSGELLV